MSTTELPNEFLQRLLEELVVEQGLIDPKCEISDGSHHGDNYLGVIRRVKVEGMKKLESGNGDDLQKKVISVIFKCLPSQSQREQLFIDAYFSNEIQFYIKILPAFLAFQNEKGIIPESEKFKCIPKCFRAIFDNDEIALILEDMKPYGFTMRERRSGLDRAHCSMIVRQIGRFHALSFALRDQKPELFNQLKNVVKETVFVQPPRETMIGYLKDIYDEPINALSFNKVPQNSKYVNRTKKFLNNYMDEMLEAVNGENAEPYSVICHGDCWTNNFLFKYAEGSDKPEDLCILDFQLMRYSSPVLDLAYLFYCCTDKAMRDEHYTDLLAEYHSSLSHFLRQLGSDPEILFPFTAFQDQMLRFGKFGLGMATIALRLFTTKGEDIPDMDEVIKNSTSGAGNLELNKNQLYNDWMHGAIIDSVDLEYI